MKPSGESVESPSVSQSEHCKAYLMLDRRRAGARSIELRWRCHRPESRNWQLHSLVFPGSEMVRWVVNKRSKAEKRIAQWIAAANRKDSYDPIRGYSARYEEKEIDL